MIVVVGRGGPWFIDLSPEYASIGLVRLASVSSSFRFDLLAFTEHLSHYLCMFLDGIFSLRSSIATRLHPSAELEIVLQKDCRSLNLSLSD